MLSRSMLRIALVILGLASLVLSSSTVFASSTGFRSTQPPPPLPLPISGALTVIASPEDYRTPDATFFDVSKDLPDLSNIQYVIITGELVDGQYQFPHQLEWSKEFGGAGVEAIQMAINPTLHTEMLAVGILSAEVVARKHEEQGTTQQPSNKRAGTNALVVRPALTYDNVQVNHTTAWYDPVNLEVNYLQDWVDYDFGPQNAGAANAYDIPWPYTASGWYIVSSNGWRTDLINAIKHSSNAHFRNVPFCSYLETNVYDNTNYVTLNLSTHGVSGGISSTYATGVCSGLLHYEDWIEFYEQRG